MKLLLIGPQGCGKGTQGEKLSEKLAIPLVTLGGIFRALPKNHPYYEQVNAAVEKGELVPVEIGSKLLVERISQQDCADGFIFDGWARRMSDLGFFDPGFDKVIVFKLSRESSIKRITGRRICDADGKTYNIYTLPKEELKKCKGKLVQREDDTKEAVNKRLDIYYSKTIEVVDYFKEQGIVIEIDAEPLPDEIFEDILSALEILQ